MEIQLQTMSALTHTVASLVQSAANKIQKALSSSCSTTSISFLSSQPYFELKRCTGVTYVPRPLSSISNTKGTTTECLPRKPSAWYEPVTKLTSEARPCLGKTGRLPKDLQSHPGVACIYISLFVSATSRWLCDMAWLVI